MGIIRGKIEAPRELRPRMNYVGDCPACQADDGNWYDKKTGEKLQVSTLEELMENNNRKPARQFENTSSEHKNTKVRTFDEKAAWEFAKSLSTAVETNLTVLVVEGAGWQFEKDSEEIDRLQRIVANQSELISSQGIENMQLLETLEAERAKNAILVAGLQKIADQDFRGNRPYECVLAEATLKAAEILKQADKDEK